MTRKEFILKTVISMAANPKFTFEDKDDEDETFTYLSIGEIYANAAGLADCLEEEGFFGEEGN